MSLLDQKHFQNEADAFAWLEAELWPEGPVCPHCGGKERIYALNGVRTKHNQAQDLLARLQKELEDSRTKRFNEKGSRTNSILNLLEAWQNDPEWRDSIVAVGETEKAEDRKEVKNLKSIDEVIAHANPEPAGVPRDSRDLRVDRQPDARPFDRAHESVAGG